MKIDYERLLGDIVARRWFGAKARTATDLQIIDHAALDRARPQVVVAVAAVHFSTGPRQLYTLLLDVEQDGRARDAVDNPETLAVLGELMAHAAVLKGTNGSFRFAGPGLDPLSPAGKQSVRIASAEQSNTSIVLDDRVMLKIFRKVEIGPNPDLEITRLLTTEGFEHIPAHVGEVVYEGVIDGEEAELDLGIAQQYLPDAVDGWTYFVDELKTMYGAAHPHDAKEDVEFLIEERSAELLAALDELGDVTAALHIALLREETENDFTPEPVDPDDVKEWTESAQHSLRVLREQGVEDLARLAPQIENRLEELHRIPDLGMKTRVHGDYHLGQVLHTTRGWQIIDFEGEPARTLEERRAKQSPLKDVAGMLRSFGYAAYTALAEIADVNPARKEELSVWADEWESYATARFLHAYLRKSHEADFLPGDRDSLMVLLDALQIDKALYEVGYELQNRPDWLPIPLHGLERLMTKGHR